MVKSGPPGCMEASGGRDVSVAFLLNPRERDKTAHQILRAQVIQKKNGSVRKDPGIPGSDGRVCGALPRTQGTQK